MKRAIGLAALLATGACISGDETIQLDRIQCESTLTIQGTWSATAPLRDGSTAGCWPVGMWTFTAAVAANPEVPDDKRCEGENAPQFGTSYGLQVVRTDGGDGWTDSYAYQGNREIHEPYRYKVTEIGGGECQAAIELYDETGQKSWNLKPVLSPTGTTLTGAGEFRVYEYDQLAGYDGPLP
jgi:hypothetical protein